MRVAVHSASEPGAAAFRKRQLHWDLICDLRPGGRLRADNETIMLDGRFTL